MHCHSHKLVVCSLQQTSRGGSGGGDRHLDVRDDHEAAAAAAPSSAGLLQGAYDKLVAVAMHATSSGPACVCDVPTSSAPVAKQHYNLSIHLASAYADLRDAQQDTERHRCGLVDFSAEMLVKAPMLAAYVFWYSEY